MGLHEELQEQDLVNDMAGDASQVVDDAPVDVTPIKMAKGPYASNVQGGRIRHAMTGCAYEHLVGSRDEYRYFKVHDATSNNAQGCGNAFFFDSPADYEKYGGAVHDVVARDWLTRRHQYFGH